MRFFYAQFIGLKAKKKLFFCVKKRYVRMNKDVE